jgi:hypothetical protein
MLYRPAWLLWSLLACPFLHTSAAAMQPLQDDERPIVENKLEIDPVIQETPEWCWLAVGEMIFTYLDLDELPSGYQCSTIGMFAGPRSECWRQCMACPLPSGTMQNFEKMVRDYPRAVAFYKNEDPPHSLRLRSSLNALEWDEIKEEIDNKRPVVAGINPGAPQLSHLPQHVALIIGYKEQNDQQLLYVNDPFPYESLDLDTYTKVSLGGKLIEDGQYLIRYDKFKQGLHWVYSAYGIEDPDKHVSQDDLKAHVVRFRAPSRHTNSENDPSLNKGPSTPSGSLSFDAALTRLVTAARNRFMFVREKCSYANKDCISITFLYNEEEHTCTLMEQDGGRPPYCFEYLNEDSDGTKAKQHFDALVVRVGQVLGSDWKRSDSDLSASGQVFLITDFDKNLGGSEDMTRDVLDKHQIVSVTLSRNDHGLYTVDFTVRGPE